MIDSIHFKVVVVVIIIIQCVWSVVVVHGASGRLIYWRRFVGVGGAAGLCRRTGGGW